MFNPTLEQIYAMGKIILPELVICIQGFPRLMEKFHLKQRVKRVPYAAVIAEDEECVRLQFEIEKGKSVNVVNTV